MNGLEEWLAANNEYLATALGWLRARLERLERLNAIETGPAALAPAGAPEPRPNRRSLLERLTRSTAGRETPLLALPPADESALSAPIPIPTALVEADNLEHPPALVLLSKRLGLSTFERYTLLLCAAMELDTRTPGLCARAQHDPNRPYPTFALALAMLDDPAWEVLSPERPLRYWRLVEISQIGAQPLIVSALRADERIVNYLKGLNHLDDRLTPLVAPAAADAGTLPPSQLAVVDDVVDRIQRSSPGVQLPLFQLVGTDSQSSGWVANQVAARLGLGLYRLVPDALPAQATDLETFLRLWQREGALLPMALYVDGSQIDPSGSPQVGVLKRVLDRVGGLVFLGTREPWLELIRETVALDVGKPTSDEQLAAWTEALAEGVGDRPPRLTSHFNFNTVTIRQIASSARATARDDPAQLDAHLWANCLRQARPALDRLAEALTPKATWQDLELPATEKGLLRQIADQVEHRARVYDAWGFRDKMNRGLGISVLFAGESGTGKTMAAEVIAHELGLMLYRIDLSAVVSKYIGETEKNLRKLFDATEDGGAILFFDEADALFGKRSEVKDSHDRYANIEINYLLQRMEAYRGLAILATNAKGALDTAFLRRLRFIVSFPFPGPKERLAIWQRALPSQIPTADLDFQRLVKLNVNGASIHNIALGAAFLAARSGTSVTMPLLLEAARTEFRKLEKPINEADFRWLEPAKATS